MSENKHVHTIINPTEEDKMKFFESYDNKLQYDGYDTGIKLVDEEAEKAKYPRFEKVPYEQFKKDFMKLYAEIPDVELDEQAIKDIYDNIALPKRSTSGSAGYDFVTPFDISMVPKSTIMIPTGIRCYMPKNLVLMIYPRSGLSSKNRLFIVNTTPIIDSDYYGADNYGHIFLKLCYDYITNPRTDSPDAMDKGYYRVRANDECDNSQIIGLGMPDEVTYLHAVDRTPWVKEHKLIMKSGDRIAQGIFTEYHVTYDDYIGKEKLGERTGGHGSTGK